MKKKILLDTNSLIHRVYHALPYLKSPKNIPVNAVYGMANIILRLIDEEKPNYIIACFDSPVPTFRHLKAKEYKATRPKTPDDLKIQIPLIKKLLNCFDIPIVEKTNYEADDVIGSLVDNENQNIIVSGDLDTLQLVDKNTIIYFLKKGIREVDVYDEKKVMERFGIKPELLPDLKALVGDPSDNIIGIKGIGEKTAAHLIQKYGSIEEIIEKAEKGAVDPAFRKLILENKEKLLLNKELAKIIRNLDINVNLKEYRFPDIEKLLPFLQELGFKSIIERLIKKTNKQPPLTLFPQRPINYQTKISEINNIIFLLPFEKNFYTKISDKFYELDYNEENLRKILEAEKLVIFDLKQFFKKSYLILKEVLPYEKFFDIKIALWLTSNLNKITLEKLANFYSPKTLFDEKDIKNFVLENYENIYEDLLKKIDELNLIKVLLLDQKISIILAIMELNGISVDLARLNEFKLYLKNELDKIKKEIFELAKTPFNINSPIELRYILFDKLKISPKGLKKTPKGEISTQESELLKLIGTHPIIEKILTYREYNKILTTFISGLEKYIDKNNRINTNFEITGSATGRISSEEPNLQNIPIEGELAKKLRYCFVSSPGFSFLALDYSQIELRIAAHFSNDENLIAIFNQNLDVHSITAKLLFKEENEKTRRLAKIINFGILYGITPKGLQERIQLPLSECKNLIEKYFKNFPGVKKMVDDFIEKAKACGYTETILGRKRFIPEIYSRSYSEQNKAFRIAINTPIQGTASEIIKLAMANIFDYIEKNNLKEEIKMVLQIHDEIIFEIKDDIIEKVLDKLIELMEKPVQLAVPLKVKYSLGKNLADLKQ